MPRKIEDLTGRTFGRLTVIRLNRDGPIVHWLCKCSCGTEKLIQGGALRSGTTGSCGCLAREVRKGYAGKFGTHYMSKTPVYYAWLAMNSRCNLESNPVFHHYGGRGISVCSEWIAPHGFPSFLRDMGLPPTGTTLDRIDTDGNYEPSNCRWADRATQTFNRRNVRKASNGRPAFLVAAENGISRAAFQNRIRRGWEVERAISEPMAHQWTKPSSAIR
jgi:hypothetical protein